MVAYTGIGKTSLLRNAQKDAATGTSTTVWATGGDSVSLGVISPTSLGSSSHKAQKRNIWDTRFEACSETARLSGFCRCGLSISRCPKPKI